MRYLSSDSSFAVSAEHKEFGLIPNLRPLLYRHQLYQHQLYQHQPCQFAIHANQERMPTRLRLQ